MWFADNKSVSVSQLNEDQISVYKVVLLKDTMGKNWPPVKGCAKKKRGSISHIK